MVVAIRCQCLGCKYNKGGWCVLDYIEINENRVCEEYEPKKNNLNVIRKKEGEGGE